MTLLFFQNLRKIKILKIGDFLELKNRRFFKNRFFKNLTDFGRKRRSFSALAARIEWELLHFSLEKNSLPFFPTQNNRMSFTSCYTDEQERTCPGNLDIRNIKETLFM